MIRDWLILLAGGLIAFCGGLAGAVVATQQSERDATEFIQSHIPVSTIEPVSNCYRVTTEFESEVLCVEFVNDEWRFDGGVE